MPKGQRKYNGTQKVEIIKRIHRENLSFKGASREYGISDRTLRDWERIYWEEGEEALLLDVRASRTSLCRQWDAERSEAKAG